MKSMIKNNYQTLLKISAMYDIHSPTYTIE